MIETTSPFDWEKNRLPSIFAAAPKLAPSKPPAKDHPLRTGKSVTACNAFAGAGGQINTGKPPKTYNIKGLAALPICSEFKLPGSRRDRSA